MNKRHLEINILSVPLEKEMATHSSILAWKIPGTAEPGGLPSMGSHRVGHDWSDLAAGAAALAVFPVNKLYVVSLPSLKSLYYKNEVSEFWRNSFSREAGQAGEIRVSGEVESSLWMLTCRTTIGLVCRSLWGRQGATNIICPGSSHGYLGHSLHLSVQHYRELWAGLWLIVLSINFLRRFYSMDAAP